MKSSLFLAVCFSGALVASPINTLLPPFTNQGGVVVAGALSPQTSPVGSAFAIANRVYGFNGLDIGTYQYQLGVTNASSSGTWDQYSGAYASASVQNGELRTSQSVSGAIPSGAFDVETFSGATFLDSLTITSSSVADGTLGYFLLTVQVTGSFSCDSTSVDFCPSGALFGYGYGTLGYGSAVHYLGGENPFPLVSTLNANEQLVPLPFLFGTPFNIQLDLLSTARLIPWAGNSFAQNDLSHTMKVIGIGITDGTSNAISNFSITSNSGLLYGANGITAVPEPSTLLFVGFGLAVGLGRLRKR